jgi:hypothetical protein
MLLRLKGSGDRESDGVGVIKESQRRVSCTGGNWNCSGVNVSRKRVKLEA